MQPMTKPSQNPIETRRRKRSSGGDSGDSFSFPSTLIHSESSSSSPSSLDDFEFGSCLTPDSPSGAIDPNKSSPADHLFLNGRLLPHSFPFRPPPPQTTISDVNSRAATSRTSSISSKDSLLSSRSNSTSSRSSSCSSSARTSTSAASSDGLERRSLPYGRQGSKSSAATASTSKAVSAQVYGSSQRWQFMAPVPALSRETSRRRKAAAVAEPKKKKAVVKRSRPRQLGRRLFRWFVSACKECHAIEPSRKDKILTRNVNLR